MVLTCLVGGKTKTNSMWCDNSARWKEGLSRTTHGKRMESHGRGYRVKEGLRSLRLRRDIGSGLWEYLVESILDKRNKSKILKLEWIWPSQRTERRPMWLEYCEWGEVKMRLERKPDARPCRSLQAVKSTWEFYSGVMGNHLETPRMGCCDFLYA